MGYSNPIIRKNMRNNKDTHDDLRGELYRWIELFNSALFKKKEISEINISFEKSRINTLGNHIIIRSNSEMRENINLNSAHLNRPLWEILLTLLHEMTHIWQTNYGKPSNSWFHNNEFKKKMLDFGIVCNSKGNLLSVVDPFVFLLKKHGVSFGYNDSFKEKVKIFPKAKLKGKSKLKKWQCPCGQTVRVGKKDFYARCDLCGDKFILVL